MAVIPMSYSPGTVARRFSILDGVTIQGVLYQVIWDSKTPFAAVIEAAPSVIDGDMRHKVVATLELQRRPQLEGVLVRKFWEDSDVAQIEGIVVDGIVRDVGLATFVYETVASKAGVVLLSDNEQYEGGKALWQHIARRSSELKVFILDTDAAQYYPFDGERVCYDGESIPESEIWSEHPDRSKHGVVLVAESITGKAA
ncbi:hypothetical protein NG308_004933 [Escherichia coli]|uniref:Uncharacterized protein n=1 Tax=Escherichia coli TaxID=562 RepID=A0A8S7T5Q3_ECOLX|nr:hypothetical protein [Escherichia coli]HAO9804084.1 hypothetical protein [Escherichia coli O25b:H4-ST131]EFH3996803.1 hypothetical protein [Escherichia coli]EFH6096903.1 hypothetical protein [Escherichia coli]EFH9594776.1 hypothetical protein [Escherichia coli]EFK4305409.1 hypothetical protein [Escherichia coli]